jgi:hypothetical protein
MFHAFKYIISFGYYPFVNYPPFPYGEFVQLPVIKKSLAGILPFQALPLGFL